MSILSTIVKTVTQPKRLEEYDRFLFVGPHPDDIEIGAGATAAKLVSLGKSVTFLICLDGRYGTGFLQDKTEDEVADIRKQESIDSAKMLGVTDVRFLDICDGGFYEKQELVEGIAGVIGEVQPDVVFGIDTHTDAEYHIDHLNVGNATTQVAYFAPYENIMKRYKAKSADVKALALYMTARANQFVNTRGFVQRQKDSIFLCHKSQFPLGTPEADSLSTYITLRSKVYGPRRLSTDCEGFRVLSATQMHCLPEAGR